MKLTLTHDDLMSMVAKALRDRGLVVAEPLQVKVTTKKKNKQGVELEVDGVEIPAAATTKQAPRAIGSGSANGAPAAPVGEMTEAEARALLAHSDALESQQLPTGGRLSEEEAKELRDRRAGRIPPSVRELTSQLRNISPPDEEPSDG